MNKDVVLAASFTIDLADHDFLASFVPSREPVTVALGKFKGYTDARYVSNPTVASELGRILYESWEGEGMAIELSSPRRICLIATREEWPASFDNDGGVEITIRSVTPAEFKAMSNGRA